MNYKKLLLCLSCLLIFDSFSQTSTETGKRKVLKVPISTDSGHMTGYVYNATDTTVTISRDFVAYHDNLLANGTRLKTFNYSNIKSVTRVRRGSIPLSALVGAASGALIGLATYQKSTGWDFGPGANAFAGGILGLPVGTLFGVLVHKEKFHINKGIKEFQTFKSNVLEK